MHNWLPAVLRPWDGSLCTSVSLGFGSKELITLRKLGRLKEGEGERKEGIQEGEGRGRKESFLSSTTPSFLFRLSSHFSRGQNTEKPVPRSFCALPHPTETLVKPASGKYSNIFQYYFFTPVST